MSDKSAHVGVFTPDVKEVVMYMKKIAMMISVLAIVFVWVQQVSLEAWSDKDASGEKPGIMRERVIDWMTVHSGMPVSVLRVVYEEAHKYTYPKMLIAIAMVESNFDPSAVSQRGAVGLTQVMADVWAAELKSKGLISEREDLFDISRSLAAADYIFGKYLSLERGDVRNALMRYAGSRAESEYQDKIMTAFYEIESL